MLINIVEREECRIAVVSDGLLQELYMERASTGSHVGNIYKGKVTNVEPSIQAAFVDFGAAKNGFLHISDVQPKFFPSGQRGTEAVGKKRSRQDRPPIQECLRRGQEVTVQVTKEGIGTKGPTLTTYLSIPGRFLVMMPGMAHHGVSRKIEDDEQRHKMREILEELKPPGDIGFIVRTAGMDRTKKDLQQDLNYLLRLWQSVEKRLKTAKAPAELYQESDLVIRTIRDIYSSEISQIVCDNERVSVKVAEFLNVVMPRGKNVVKYYNSPTPLFHRYNLEQEIEKIYSRRVELPTGGSLVIDQTEALVAIDVNSGRNRQADNAEETAFRTNVTAAKEIARQLRLRDMGGVIIIDFIDMREDKHRREIERVLRDAIKNDRARTKVLKISRFGIVEMTRQRVRPSLRTSIYRECPACRASGLIKSDESLALDLMRNLQLAFADDSIAAIELTVAPPVAEYLNNRRRATLAQLESQTTKSVVVRGDTTLLGDSFVFRCSDGRGSLIAWDPAAASKAAAAPPGTPKNRPLGPLADELIEIFDTSAQLPTSEEEETTEIQREVEAFEEAVEPAETAEVAAPGEAAVALPGAEAPKKRRRRRGGRKHRRRKLAAQEAAGAALPQTAQGAAAQPTTAPAEASAAPEAAEEEADRSEFIEHGYEEVEPAPTAEHPSETLEAMPEEGKKKSRRRRRHRSRKGRGAAGETPAAAQAQMGAQHPPVEPSALPDAITPPEPPAPAPEAPAAEQPSETAAESGAAAPKRRRRRPYVRRPRKGSKAAQGSEPPASNETPGE